MNDRKDGMTMKKTLALILALVLALSAFGALAATKAVKIDKKNFPDQNLRGQVAGPDFDFNEDGKLSPAEIKKNDTISVQFCDISDLTGIEYFPYVKVLCVNGNHLKKLDVSKYTKLVQLWVSWNKLTRLDVSKNKKLKELRCNNCSLKKLTLGKQKYLATLDCAGNKKLKKLDIGKCSKLLKYVKKGKKIKKDGYVEWHVGNNPDYNYLRIPKTCKLYNGKKVLYKGK